MAMPTHPKVTDTPQASRYELWLGTTRAGFIQYRAKPGTVLLVHTEVDPAFEGQGLGEQLVAGALADLRARGLKLVPLCPFVRAYLRRRGCPRSPRTGPPPAPTRNAPAACPRFPPGPAGPGSAPTWPTPKPWPR